MTIHVVKQGDTIETIAAQYNVTVDRIVTDNVLPNPQNLVIGQSLGIRFPTTVHTIVQGDTLDSVARQYNVSAVRILQNNPWAATVTTLPPGRTLVITYREQATDGNKYFNGYAYTYINNDILKTTLPFLSYGFIFTYGFSPNGDLVTIDDADLIATMKNAGVGPTMVIAPMDATQTFNSQIAHNLFANPQGVTNLVNNIFNNMQAKGYVALDIDFEFVQPADKQAFLNFITAVTNKLRPAGLLTFVDLAPKTSGTQTGLLYEAHDYPAIGAIADRVMLMTYEWGYTFSEPMATAPVNNVRQVLQYGISVIPKEKIIMGLPNYAYDWPLPFVQGKTKAESISNQEAIRRAAANKSTIQFDDQSQCPFFNYTTADGIQHVVWFDDVRSIRAKINLINELGIAGGGVWQIMDFFPGMWMVVNELFTVNKV